MMQHHMGYSFHRDPKQTWREDLSAIPESICRQIQDLAQELEPGQIIAGPQKIRSSHVAWITGQEIPEFLPQISQWIQDTNQRLWQYDLWGILDGIQISRYQTGDYYRWHRDNHHGLHPRKLTLVCQLSKPTEYQGGDLELSLGSREQEQDRADRNQGTLILFPSWLEHQVTEVTKGTRWSMTLWCSGPKFK